MHAAQQASSKYETIGCSHIAIIPLPSDASGCGQQLQVLGSLACAARLTASHLVILLNVLTQNKTWWSAHKQIHIICAFAWLKLQRLMWARELKSKNMSWAANSSYKNIQPLFRNKWLNQSTWSRYRCIYTLKCVLIHLYLDKAESFISEEGEYISNSTNARK
jgi:hypothetical protein